MRQTREVQRAARRRAGKPQVAVVGYTNAGKSSLVAALSRQPIEARDRRARPSRRSTFVCELLSMLVSRCNVSNQVFSAAHHRFSACFATS